MRLVSTTLLLVTCSATHLRQAPKSQEPPQERASVFMEGDWAVASRRGRRMPAAAAWVSSDTQRSGLVALPGCTRCLFSRGAVRARLWHLPSDAVGPLLQLSHAAKQKPLLRADVFALSGTMGDRRRGRGTGRAHGLCAPRRGGHTTHCGSGVTADPVGPVAPRGGSPRGRAGDRGCR